MGDMNGLRRRSRRKGAPAQRLGLVMLLVLAFGLGLLAAQVDLTPAASGRVSPLVAPATPTPLPPTPAPSTSPTPTAPDGAGVLPTLYIDIAPDDFAAIEAKRAEALETWILLTGSEDLVPATVRVGDQAPVDVRLRLKGDWGDHFATDKWSYRVETRGDGALLGMRVFSLQDPSTRSYLNEWLFMRNARDEDVLAVGYDFVHGVQNGRYMGIYALEEGFSKELLESQARREGVILRYNEDLLWDYWARLDNDLVLPRGVQDFYLIDEFDSGKVRDTTTLSAQRDVAVGELRAWWQGDLTASHIFDVERLARFWALADLWDATHALKWHNLRYYYNPITTRLEPIAFDVQPLADDPRVDAAKLPGRRQMLLYEDALLQRAYVAALWRYSQPGYLDDLRARYGDILAALRAALEPEFGGRETALGRSVLAAPWDSLTQRQASLRELLTPHVMTYAYQPALASAEPLSVTLDTLTLDVGNILAFPVEIVGVRVGDDRIPAGRAWLDAPESAGVVASETAGDALVLHPLAPDAEFVEYVRLHIPIGATLVTPDQPAWLETRIWGLTATVTQPVLAAYPSPVTDIIPPAPSLEDALRRYPYLRVGEGDQRWLTVEPGVWTITETLVLPAGYGLHLEAGTTLQFAPDAYLLARGPLSFVGTERASVVLQPLDEVWGGIVVLDAGSPSTWQYVTVERTGGITLPGWSLTGGITFYQSPLTLDHVRILGTLAEDGLNVIRAPFYFVDSEFAGTASDAFDADFCEGEIERTSFHDVAADGIDVSGSRVEVRDVRMVRVSDKALSVGEASYLTLDGLNAEAVTFGIVSKDLSHVTARNVTVVGARLAAFAAYVKKPEYGPASMVVELVTLEDVPDERITLVQTGSWIDLEGVRVWGEDVDVDALYESPGVP